MTTRLLAFTLLIVHLLIPAATWAAPTAQEIIDVAQQQLTIPAELVPGEMKVYLGEKLVRSYSFVLGRLWEHSSQTEYVRIDFKNAIDPSPSTGHRYLLKRAAQTTPTQWLYLPALRRVRLTSYRPDEPLLQSDYLFYDLTTIQDFADYRYRFIDANEQAPIVEGEPHTDIVPYQRTVSALERRGSTYLLTGITYLTKGKERHARFLDYAEVASGRFRPQKIIITAEGGSTEILFGRWTFPQPDPQLFTSKSLEARFLNVGEDGGEN